jgi:hypothetical protein
MQMPIPTKSKGVALTRVSAKALVLPNAPSQRALYASTGLTFKKNNMTAPRSKAIIAANTGRSVSIRREIHSL